LANKLASIDSTFTKQVNNFVWWSDSFELKAPFAIYKALRAQNVDARTASAMVLSTMNFTKHGSAMSPLKSLYMFAQPAVTGAHQTAKTLGTTKGKLIGAGLFFSGMAAYALLSEMGGEDPVSKRRRIDMLNAGTVEKSLPIYMPDGSVVKVPVPFGLYQLAWSAAANTMRAANGTTNMTDAGFNIFKSGLKSISPIGVAETEFTKDPFVFLTQMFTPTIVKPVTNVATNTNTFGSSISNDVKPGQPAWRQARKDTPDIYVDISKLMLDYASVNTSPETLRELTGLIAYGPIGELRKGFSDNPTKDERGIKRPSQMIDRFVMEQSDSKTASAYYYEVRSQLAKIHLRKLSAKPGEPDLTEKERQLNSILEADDRVHSTINAQWAQLRKMKNDGRVSDDEYRQRYQQLTQRDNESRARFITRYNEVK
jgi:Large polyvalent protein associated domain 38